jgi:hypothetical protein
MASAHLKGTARINYTPPGGGDTTHLLAVPLLEIEPVDATTRYEWWSADMRSRSVVTVGGGVYELHATIRMENQPALLKTMLRHALNSDVTLTYRTVGGGTAYPVKLVAVIGAGPGESGVRPDRDRHGFGEWESRVHLRRVDGSTLDGLL